MADQRTTQVLVQVETDKGTSNRRASQVLVQVETDAGTCYRRVSQVLVMAEYYKPWHRLKVWNT